MTKILFTVTTDLNFDQRMQRICTALYDSGFQVKLIGRALKESTPLIKTSFEQKRIHCFFNKGKLFYFEFNLRLFLYLLFQKSDIICSVDLDTILPSFLVSKVKRKKLVFDAHEYFTESANLIHRKFEQQAWKAIESYILPKIKYAYTVNQSIANIFEKEYGVKFEVIRNVPYYKNNEDSVKQKNIIYQGAVRRDRGLDELVKSMQFIDSKLIIAGGGEFLNDLKNITKKIQIEHKVEFIGQCTPQELTEITKSAYIGISPLEPVGFNHLYSLSNKFLEYIQLEIPQIAMNFEEYKQINKKYNIGLLIDDTKAEIFAENINKLLHDYTLYTSLKLGASEAKKELNWENEKEKLIFFYHKIPILH